MSAIVEPATRQRLAALPVEARRFVVGVERGRVGNAIFHMTEVAEAVEVAAGKFVGIAAKPPVGSRRPLTCAPIAATFYGPIVDAGELPRRLKLLGAELFDIVVTYGLDGSVTRLALAETTLADAVRASGGRA